MDKDSSRLGIRAEPQTYGTRKFFTRSQDGASWEWPQAQDVIKATENMTNGLHTLQTLTFQSTIGINTNKQVFFWPKEVEINQRNYVKKWE